MTKSTKTPPKKKKKIKVTKREDLSLRKFEVIPEPLALAKMAALHESPKRGNKELHSFLLGTVKDCVLTIEDLIVLPMEIAQVAHVQSDKAEYGDAYAKNHDRLVGTFHIHPGGVLTATSSKDDDTNNETLAKQFPGWVMIIYGGGQGDPVERWEKSAKGLYAKLDRIFVELPEFLYSTPTLSPPDEVVKVLEEHNLLNVLSDKITAEILEEMVSKIQKDMDKEIEVNLPKESPKKKSTKGKGRVPVIEDGDDDYYAEMEDWHRRRQTSGGGSSQSSILTTKGNMLPDDSIELYSYRSQDTFGTESIYSLTNAYYRRTGNPKYNVLEVISAKDNVIDAVVGFVFLSEKGYKLAWYETIDHPLGLAACEVAARFLAKKLKTAVRDVELESVENHGTTFIVKAVVDEQEHLLCVDRHNATVSFLIEE